jgi:hypothetical protein
MTRKISTSQPTTDTPAAVAEHVKSHASVGGGKSKYKNEKTNGYSSKKEAKRATELKLLLKAGKIRNLREQVRYELIPKQDGERACSYVADFVYDEAVIEKHWSGPRWFPVVEDAKGMRTPLYVIKRKLMLRVHGIKIREV